MHVVPDWLVHEPIHESELGVLTSGKEAQIDLYERTAADGRTCLVARKRYRPREVKEKGELEALGFQTASGFRRDHRYLAGRDLRLGDRERRAMAGRTTYGKKLLRGQWTEHEFIVLREWWDAGVQVPYPIRWGTDDIDMQYVGDLDGAAPQLSAARLEDHALAVAHGQLLDGLKSIVAGGWVHGDLSAYNLLWWEGSVWFIDVPQAVRISTNLDALDLLHRDVLNVSTWFARRGVESDGEEIFAELLSEAL